MNRDNLYPYLVPGPVDPAAEPFTISVGHGLYAVLFEDHESAAGIVHATVAPDDLRAAGLTPAEAHRVALDNLLKFADADDRLSIQMLGKPGEAVHFLLYSEHPRASACLRLPDLYDQARELLETDAICACVPQRDALVVLPKRDRAYREMLVTKLREIEADAQRPISFELFDLSPAGLQPFTEPA